MHVTCHAKYICLHHPVCNSLLQLQFDGVLENVSQDTVYSACAHDAVNSVLAGVNACVFCYGQVGNSTRVTSNLSTVCWHASCSSTLQQHKTYCHCLLLRGPAHQCIH
jgi:hypothetical protein